MRTEQLTKWFEPLLKLTAMLAPLNRFMSLQLYYITDHSNWGGTSDVVLCVACFDVSFCIVFTFYVPRGCSVMFGS